MSENNKSKFMDTLEDMGYKLNNKENGRWIFVKQVSTHKLFIIFNVMDKYINSIMFPGAICSKSQMKYLVEVFLEFKKDAEKLAKMSKYQLL